MGIGRILGKKLTEKYKSKEQILKPQAEKIFNRLFTGWFVLGYSIGLMVEGMGIQFYQCEICGVSNLITSLIHAKAVGSQYVEPMHFVWLYFIVTSPILLGLLFFFVKEFNRRLLPIWGVLYLLLLISFAAWFLFSGVEVGLGGADDGGKFAQANYQFLLASSFFACANIGVMLICLFYLTHHFIELLSSRGEEHDR